MGIGVIDHNLTIAGAVQHTTDVAQGLLDIWEMVQHARTVDDIDASIGEGQRASGKRRDAMSSTSVKPCVSSLSLDSASDDAETSVPIRRFGFECREKPTRSLPGPQP